MAETDFPRPALDTWAEAFCLKALAAYGIDAPALEGVIVGVCSDSFTGALDRKGFILTRRPVHPLPEVTSGLFADFVVWLQGAGEDEDAAGRWEAIKAWLGRLKIGGVGIVVACYDPDTGPMRSALALDMTVVSANEIGKWALLLISEGYSVAPLAFARLEDLPLDDRNLARFALVVQRQ